MKIAVWRTGHEISDTVAKSLISLNDSSLFHTSELTEDIIASHDCHIGYGILRGMDSVFRMCDTLGKPWFNVDRGYFAPGHYDGYYRVSLGCTQYVGGNIAKVIASGVGTGRFNLQFYEWRGLDANKSLLICPPTPHVCKFFGIDENEWIKGAGGIFKETGIKNVIVRRKGIRTPLKEHFDKSGLVFTFNSTVGLEALSYGIPVISSGSYSLVGSSCRGIGVDNISSFQHGRRRDIFSAASNLQLTLEDMREGKLWPVMNLLMSS